MSAELDSAASKGKSAGRSGSPVWDLLAWAGLAAAVLAILWPLGLTNRVLAGVDAFTYFEPYWAYRSAALSAGRMPLWNPYIFLGVPFLANPQAAVLYPLHWPLVGLPAERALVWSALLHTWLAAGLAYTFARRSFRVTRPAAWLAGVLFGTGGFSLARIENINQLNALAWLPATLWLYDETVRAREPANRPPLGRRAGRGDRAPVSGRPHTNLLCKPYRSGVVRAVHTGDPDDRTHPATLCRE